VKEDCIPGDWKSSVVLPIYRGKGYPMECGSYRRIKLLEHAMKVVERIFEHRIRQQVDIHDMQFRFMKGKGTTDTILLRDALQCKAQFCDRMLSVYPSVRGFSVGSCSTGLHGETVSFCITT